MSNPYESAFGENTEENKPPEPEKPLDFAELPPLEEGPESLDELLDGCRDFVKKANHFATRLSQINAAQYEVSLGLQRQWLQLLVTVKDPHDQGNLAAERQYHQQLTNHFHAVIAPMRQLAQQHLDILQQYFQDIDEHYFSPQRSPLETKRDTEEVKSSILLQRTILEEGAKALEYLETALRVCEQRCKQYVNSGAGGNISASELALLIRERQQLTSGKISSFNYEFFRLNLLDKAKVGLGILTAQTSIQYLQELQLALSIK